MTINHLVLGGGGVGGFAIYGALKYLAKHNYWNIENIKSIYATSIGSFMAILIALKYDWEVLDDYLIKRPWDKAISIKPLDLINIWNEKGLFNKDVIKIILKPLLEAKELSENITLKEFYEKTNIDFHIYSTNINSGCPIKIDLSCKTYPDLEVYKAIAMSCAFPMVFSPVYDNSGCYIDGGLLNNFPLDDCINDNNNIDNIFAIKISNKQVDTINYINENSNLQNYLFTLLNGMIRIISTENNQQIISNILECKFNEFNLNYWKDALFDANIRENIINEGEKYAKIYLENKSNPLDISNNL